MLSLWHIVYEITKYLPYNANWYIYCANQIKIYRYSVK